MRAFRLRGPNAGPARRKAAPAVLAVTGIAVAAVIAIVTVIALQPSGPAGGGHGDAAAGAGVLAPTSAASTAVTSATPSSASRSPRPAAVPSPKTSSRKGVSAWQFDGVDQALQLSGASWYYTWSTTHRGIDTPNGVQFVPMIWGARNVNDRALAQAQATGGDLLGFNEPDLSSQADMTVDQALDLWPQLEATGMTLGSPAVSYYTRGGWLDQFMSGAADRGYRVDFIALHWYGSDFTTAAAVSALKSYVQAVYQRYHKPIWLTEYALIKFTDSGSTYPADAQQAAFVTASTTMLDGLPYVKRYAWYALPATTGSGTGLFMPGAQPTPAGLAFEQAR